MFLKDFVVNFYEDFFKNMTKNSNSCLTALKFSNPVFFYVVFGIVDICTTGGTISGTVIFMDMGFLSIGSLSNIGRPFTTSSTVPISWIENKYGGM